MKQTIFTLLASMTVVGATAQSITATWELSNPDNLSSVTITGDEEAATLITLNQETGSKIGRTRLLEQSGAETGFDPVVYTPPFTAFSPTTKVSSKTAGHCISMSVTPKSGHKFKPTSISFDAVKVGTDGGAVDVYYSINRSSETAISTGLGPLRNKITAANSTGYSHYEYPLGDVITDGQPFVMTIYLMNINGVDNSSPKEIGLRNVSITGAVDEEVTSIGSYVKGLSCLASETIGG